MILEKIEKLFVTQQLHRNGECSWLTNLRQNAFANVKARGLPRIDDDAWKYSHLKRFLSESYTTNYRLNETMPPHFSEHLMRNAQHLVIYNGSFKAEYSDDLASIGLAFYPIEEAPPEEQNTLARTWTSSENTASSALEELNRALFDCGYILKIQANCALNKPLHIVMIHDSDSLPSMRQDRLHIIMEAHSTATIFFSLLDRGESQWTNNVVDLHLKDNARMQWVHESLTNSTHVYTHHLRATLDRDAQLKTFSLAVGGHLQRHDIQIDLTHSGASVHLDGLTRSMHSSHIDHYTQIRHSAPHTSSDQLYKAIILDNSKAIFSGKIKIAPYAQQVIAMQLNKNLLLGDEAEAMTRPQLEIDADDVRCSHGATIGRLSEQELFYLLSRGISPQTAEALLAKAFVSDVIGRTKNAVTQQRLLQCLAPFESHTILSDSI